MTSQSNTFSILTIDGGGIKGLFAARILARLQAAYPSLLKQTRLFAGTSSGGLIALALAAGRTPDEIVDLFLSEAKTIFKDSAFDNVRDLGRAIGADYNHRGLKKVVRRIIGDNITLGDLKQRVLIPTFDLDSPADGLRPRMMRPKFFHNCPGSDSDRGELAVDVAMRTSAAPTYFPSYQGYIDGGVVANNPSMSALAMALDRRAGKQQLDNIRLLSLGTGAEAKYMKGQRLNWGWTQWAKPLSSLMISGVEGVADYQCRQILGNDYQRVDAYLMRRVELDDIKPKTLDYLIAEADRIRLPGIVNWLTQRGWPE